MDVYFNRVEEYHFIPIQQKQLVYVDKEKNIKMFDYRLKEPLTPYVSFEKYWNFGTASKYFL